MPVYKTAAEKPHAGFLTTAEAGKALGISPETVRYHIQHHHLEAMVKSWRYGTMLRIAYFIPIAEIKRFGFGRVVDRYGPRKGGRRPKPVL